MSRKRYPMVRDVGQLTRPDGECCACDKPTTHWVRVAWDYMRGNDETEMACKRHAAMADDFDREGQFFAHQATKDKFLKARGSSNE